MQLSITKTEANELVRRWSINQFMGNEAVITAFWNSLNRDERIFMDSIVSSIAYTWVKSHLDAIEANMVREIGWQGVKDVRDDPERTFQFAPEPERE